jgi:ABC-2 type transport system permease protein
MKGLLRAELLKQRSTRTTVGLLAAMLVLVLLAELLHVSSPAADKLATLSRQKAVLMPGQLMGTLFAALLGALAITGEIRHGTIRPTLLANPRRVPMLVAKAAVSALFGAGLGLVAGAAAEAVVVSVLAARGITIHLDAGDYALPLLGGAAAGALWAAIGVGVGALVRNQVATLVGLCAWLLFAEQLLLGDLANLAIHRYLPGAAAAALAGQKPETTTLLAPAAALVLLVAYSAASVVAGSISADRRDVG